MKSKKSLTNSQVIKKLNDRPYTKPCRNCFYCNEPVNYTPCIGCYLKNYSDYQEQEGN